MEGITLSMVIPPLMGLALLWIGFEHKGPLGGPMWCWLWPIGMYACAFGIEYITGFNAIKILTVIGTTIILIFVGHIIGFWWGDDSDKKEEAP